MASVIDQTLADCRLREEIDALRGDMTTLMQAAVAASVNSYGYPLEKPYGAEFRAIATGLGAGDEALMQDVETLHLDATITFPDAPADSMLLQREIVGRRETLVVPPMNVVGSSARE